MDTRWPGLPGASNVEQNETLVGLGELVCDAIDGLCSQAGLQPDGFDMGRASRVIGLLIEISIEQVRAPAPAHNTRPSPVRGPKSNGAASDTRDRHSTATTREQ